MISKNRLWTIAMALALGSTISIACGGPVTPTVELGAEYRNAAGGFSLRYPEGWLHHENKAMVVFMESEEGPVGVNVVAGTLRELTGKSDFTEITDPVDLLQAMADDQSTAPGPEDVEGRIEELEIGGYPSAAVDLSLAYEGNSARGRFVIILVEKRVVIAWATRPSDEWEAFRPTFATMLRSLTFFEPQGGH